MSDSLRLVVATVNTYFGRAVLEDGGLEAVADADVLLMQEVFNPSAYGLEPRLRSYGFELLAAGGHFGLAIALKSNSAFTPTAEPARSTVFQQIGTLERVLTPIFVRQELEYSDLGVLAVQLQTSDGRRLTIATTHLPVMTSFRQRARFLARLPAELADRYYQGSLVLTGDMNHYPGPSKADRTFRRAAGLTAIDLSSEITWPARKTGDVGRKLWRRLGGQLDDILYRGANIDFVREEVVDVASDHRAVVATFTVENP
jgi:endonuclease/exonuclease/phosphatase family metal-dependent hydrolase